MTSADLIALFNEVYAEHGIPELGEGEFTTAMFANAKGISANRADKILDSAVAAGDIERVGERRYNNRKAMAYRKKLDGGVLP